MMTQKITPPDKGYSFLIGLRKTIKNGLIMLWPLVLVVGNYIPIEHAALYGLITYWLKNLKENW